MPVPDRVRGRRSAGLTDGGAGLTDGGAGMTEALAVWLEDWMPAFTEMTA